MAVVAAAAAAMQPQILPLFMCVRFEYDKLPLSPVSKVWHPVGGAIGGKLEESRSSWRK